MNSPLSNKELELKSLLLQVDPGSAWFMPVRDILQEGISWKIRRLFAELKSQRADNPAAMRIAIGQDAAEKLAGL
ncbi:MAG: hypothetical protein KF862_07340 [Chitinophagaceae bacterium]|nr:hypothetical protein [Chitinophagaceae bacterium]